MVQDTLMAHRIIPEISNRIELNYMMRQFKLIDKTYQKTITGEVTFDEFIDLDYSLGNFLSNDTVRETSYLDISDVIPQTKTISNIKYEIIPLYWFEDIKRFFKITNRISSIQHIPNHIEEDLLILSIKENGVIKYLLQVRNLTNQPYDNSKSHFMSIIDEYQSRNLTNLPDGEFMDFVKDSIGYYLGIWPTLQYKIHNNELIKTNPIYKLLK